MKKLLRNRVVRVMLVILTLGGGIWFWRVWRTHRLKILATKMLVAWVYQAQPIPNLELQDITDNQATRNYEGYAVNQARGEHMRAKANWYLICDFLPPQLSLSSDTRLARLTREEYAIRQKQADLLEESAFLGLNLVEANYRNLNIEVVIFSDFDEVYLYQFFFEHANGNLYVTGIHSGGS